MSSTKTLTALDVLKDEEKYLLQRLTTVRNHIARLNRGEWKDDVVTIAVGAQSVSVAGIKSAGVGN